MKKNQASKSDGQKVKILWVEMKKVGLKNAQSLRLRSYYITSVIAFIVFASCNATLTAVPAGTDVTNSREEVITMQVTIQVSAAVARALHQRDPPTAESEELLRIIETSGLTLEPMHRYTDDPNLQSYFTVEVLDHATAQSVMNRLQQLEAVKAAYVKPPDELP